MTEINVKSDVVVAGGGLAGTFAAIASARLGCRTVLIQDRPVLGGNASSELAVGISGADCSGGALARYARETGLMGEFALELLQRSADYASAIPLHSVILWEMVKREPNLGLYLNTSLRTASTDHSGAITAVRACQISNEREYMFFGKYFIDCTGHGTLGAAAGALFRMGREARSEFNESLAPEAADSNTMGNSLIFRARNMRRPVSFIAPDWAAKFPTDDSLPFRHPVLEKVDQESDEAWGYWWIEYGGQRNTIEDAEEIHDELLRILFGVWNHMKNTGDHGMTNYALTWMAPLPSRRESRRLVGDYILTENDVRARVLFHDRIAYGGWPIDIHPPEGIYSKERPCTHEYLSDFCGIPFRSLYSKNIPNLLFAGRNISVTHVALGTVRVMATCALMGQAAGTAAALCVHDKLMPREFGKQRIHALQQQLLKDDCYIVGMRNEDPTDMARTAVATASSEQVLSVSQVDEWHELTQSCAQMFPVSADRIDAIEIYLRSSLAGPVTVKLVLCAADGINDFGSQKEMATAKAAINAGQESWVRFDLNIALGPHRFYWLRLPELRGLFWAVQAQPPLGANRASFMPGSSPEWKSFRRLSLLKGYRGAFLFRLHPESRPYSAANVLSGVTRPDDWTHCWVSDPCQALPQWINLTFPYPVILNRVHLTFDADLDMNIYLPPPWGHLGQGMVKTMIRDYRLTADTGSQWCEIVVVRGNIQRLRIHRFDPLTVRRLRLECLATHGAKEARIYEIRVYGLE